MLAETTPPEQTQQRLLLDKAFFGKDTCLTVQVRGDACFFKWGRKVGEKWDWKNVKFSDVELGEIIRVLAGDQGEAKFYHAFKNDSTQIWISRQDKAVILKAGEYTKGLQPGEQKVLEVLLSHSIWMMTVS